MSNRLFQNSIANRKRGVLVVDDSPMIRKLLDLSLRSRGYEVWEAVSGREAVEIFEKYQDEIDLILIDVHMPGLDGPRTLTEIRLTFPRVLSCFMSGDLGVYTEVRLLEMGAQKVFMKPFRFDEVSKVLKGILDDRDKYEISQEDRWEDDGGRGEHIDSEFSAFASC